ncbi:transcription factor IIF subunit tfg1 [Conoideocrella luteorostrata]|uniref:Transcription factor IIF subunit tfg1 n=1 Tax=Conoideocrella luteorostrata TaxID=1105319 RepID=A0AAJ0CIA3_9HYPO|nr:transcription factor IIF subunit tfg1 [Conoideocrella luteorostrata]
MVVETPHTQNGAHRSQKPNPLRPMRKRTRPVNPLVASSRKIPGQTTGKPTLSGTEQTGLNGSKSNIDDLRRQYGGWSEPPPQYPYKDIPIMTTKKCLLEGMRYHLMKFSQPRVSDNPVDPTDQNEFARPVTLHRRDARQPPPGRTVKDEEPESQHVDEREVERLAQIKAEREVQRAIDQAKIAPVAKETNPKRPKKQKEEKTMFNRAPKSEAAKKESDIRYEEALPWHLEDADGKNVWVGNYVAALSEANVTFMIDKSVFRMVPLEKWYRFTAKPPFQPFTIDQAEAFMNRKVDVGRWAMKDEEKKAGQDDLEATRKLLYGRGQMVKTESDTFKAASRSEKLDHDELDVSGDEFQDDDETPYFERMEDDDVKESKDRIRREQLGANLFGEGDEQEVDKELRERLREELERQKYGKSTKKALIKRDREDIYESDKSEENPWSSSVCRFLPKSLQIRRSNLVLQSEDESSDDEKEDTSEGQGKDMDNKEAQGEAKDKPKGPGSKGSVTPQGKHKAGDPMKKTKSLKRAGSPSLSESSGNESSRKKLKKTSITAPGSRAVTPVSQSRMARRTLTGPGSGSDGEGTAGEMSDSAVGPRKTMKLISSSGKGTPAVSRAGSPNPALTATSPASLVSAGIESWEILEKIPAEGISLQDLVKQFHGRVGDRHGQMNKSDWIKLVKQLCDYGQDKRLRRRK